MTESHRRQIASLIDRLDPGESVDAALASLRAPVPRYLSELLRGASRTPHAGRLLAEYLDQTRKSSDRWRRVRVDLTTPALLIVATSVLMLFVLTWIVPQFT